jgi:hypothetical protein
MGKRGSGTPRHPRSPVAKAARTPAFKMQVVPDSEVVGGSAALRIRHAPGGYKRWKVRLQQEEPETKADDPDKAKD